MSDLERCCVAFDLDALGLTAVDRVGEEEAVRVGCWETELVTVGRCDTVTARCAVREAATVGDSTGVSVTLLVREDPMDFVPELLQDTVRRSSTVLVSINVSEADLFGESDTVVVSEIV